MSLSGSGEVQRGFVVKDWRRQQSRRRKGITIGSGSCNVELLQECFDSDCKSSAGSRVW